MSLVNLGCPHCNGLIEVDDQFAGHQISCPTCHGVVTVPSWADLNPAQAPPPMDQYGYGAGPPPFAPPPPMDFAPPPPMSAPESSAMQLSCPHCASAFSVTHEMQGHEAHCPTCGGVVTIPMLGGGYAESPPPAFEPPPFSPQQQFVPQQQPAFQQPFAPQPPFVPQQPFEPQQPVPQQSFAPQPQFTPQQQFAPQQPFSPQPASVPISPMNPMGPISPISTSSTPAPSSYTSANTPIPVSSATQTPSAPATVSRYSSSEAPVLIPTEDGRQVAVSAPVKTVMKGRQEIELRKLSPEEKATRRRNMNLIMMAFCMIFLGIVFFVLLRK